MKMVTGGDPISIIIKLVGEVCNIDCLYCYEKRKPYNGARVIEPDTVFSFIDKCGPRLLSLELHGGEPLLYPRVKMREIVSYVANRKDQIGLSIQTNGLRLSKDWLDLFEPVLDILQIGVSLDGLEPHNTFRLDHKGRQTRAAVEKKLELLDSAGIRYGVIVVVHRRNFKSPTALIDYFTGFPGLRALKFVPCFDFGVEQSPKTPRSRGTSEVLRLQPGIEKDWAVAPNEYSTFLIETFKYCIERDVLTRLAIEPFLSTIRSLMAIQTDSCIYSETKCRHVVTLYPDGWVGSCDELDREDAGYGSLDTMGREAIDINALFSKTAVARNLGILDEQCRVCSVRTVCKGGCIATRTRLHRVGRDHQYCDYRRSYIDHVRNACVGVN